MEVLASTQSVKSHQNVWRNVYLCFMAAKVIKNPNQVLVEKI